MNHERIYIVYIIHANKIPNTNNKSFTYGMKTTFTNSIKHCKTRKKYYGMRNRCGGGWYGYSDGSSIAHSKNSDGDVIWLFGDEI